MGLDIDYVVAKEAITKLEEILSDIPHGKREEICEDIIIFVTEMNKKYRNNINFVENVTEMNRKYRNNINFIKK